MQHQIHHQFDATKDRGRTKPDGGFCFIPAEAILRAWFAYRRGFIKLADLRVWLACFELVARRKAALRHLQPCYRFEEVQRLVGSAAVGHVRTSINRLQAAGLVDWSETKIELAVTPPAWDLGTVESFDCTIALVANNRRKVPVPRRVLRFMAGCQRRVIIATIIGHLLRCMYYRNGQCASGGTCKASWVAIVFEVDERSVKSARSHLVRIGLLERKPSSQLRLNRWGLAVFINLAWTMPGNTPSKTPPRTGFSTTGSPPPYRDRNLSSRTYNNQKPTERGPAGVWKKATREGKPSLRNIVPRDLRDMNRLSSLFHQAVAAGWVKACESHQLNFYSMAEHAHCVGRQNPCGLFATLARRGLWRFATQKDEDSARRRLQFRKQRPILENSQNLKPRAQFGTRRSALMVAHVSSILPVCVEGLRNPRDDG